MKPIVVGIMAPEKVRKRLLAIVRGEIRPGADEPKIWFSSMRSLAEVLSDANRALLRVILAERPESIARLAQITGRKPSNLSRTLATMSRFGIVELKREGPRRVRPIVLSADFRIVA